MTDTRGEDDAARLRADAALWVVRVHAPESSEADWRALEAWLGASTARQDAFDAAERLWIEYDDPQLATAYVQPLAPPVVVPILAVGHHSARGWLPQAMAACIAALCAMGALFAWRATSGPPAQVFRTLPGQTRLVALADGSWVRLNSGSQLTAWIGRGERRVALDAGEAAFDVARDPAHPFVVGVADQSVTVVGTEFDIVRTQRQVAVTVASGIVDVATAGRIDRLTPGLRATHNLGTASTNVTSASAADALAWTKGYLAYRNRPLASVVADLNRTFATPIRVEGAAGVMTFSGVLMLDSEDAVVNRLSQFLPIRVVRTPGLIVLQPR